MKKSWFEKETEKIYAKELDQHMRTTGQDLSMLSKEDQKLVVRHRLGKARERRDSKQTIVEQRKRRKRKQGYASESMGKQGKPRASTRELRSLALLARFARPTQ